MEQSTKDKFAKILADAQAKAKAQATPKFKAIQEPVKPITKAPEAITPPPAIKATVKDNSPEISDFTIDSLMQDITPAKVKSIEVAAIPESATTQADERQALEEEFKQWLKTREAKPEVKQPVKPQLEIFDYSEKAFAVIGNDTEANKEKLFRLGGKFNRFLKCGPGWIFSKKRETDVRIEFSL